MKTIEELEKQMKLNQSREDFFLSNTMLDFLYEIVTDVIGCKKDIEIVLEVSDDEDYVAYTEFDNAKDYIPIYINVTNKYVKRVTSFEEQCMDIIGSLSHEIGHILFTNPQCILEFQNNIFKGNLWPTDSCELKMQSEYGENAKKELLYCLFRDPGQADLIAEVFAYVANVFEDYNIERKMCENYPGLIKECIEFSRSNWFEQSDSEQRGHDELVLTKYSLFSLVFDCSPDEEVLDKDCFMAIKKEFDYYGFPADELTCCKLYEAITICLYSII